MQTARNKEWVIPRVDCVEKPPPDKGYKCLETAGGDGCRFNETTQKQQCTVTIPGYFKLRSRFADFPGLFVQHCHILAHEDWGMM